MKVGDHHALLLAFVREHGPRTTSPIAHTFGTEVLAMLVDLNEAALIERHTGALRSSP